MIIKVIKKGTEENKKILVSGIKKRFVQRKQFSNESFLPFSVLRDLSYNEHCFLHPFYVFLKCEDY